MKYYPCWVSSRPLWFKRWVVHFWVSPGKFTVPFPRSILGRLSRNGGDGTDNVKKVIVLIGKTTILQAARFLEHFIAVPAR